MTDTPDFTIGKRYTSEDMYRDFPELNPGDRIAVEMDGLIFTDTIKNIVVTGAIPALTETPNWWQRILRSLTPPSWRKPLKLVPSTAVPSRILINGQDAGPIDRALTDIGDIVAYARQLVSGDATDDIQELELEPLDDVAKFNDQQDFTKPGVVMGADGIVRPYTPPPWLSGT